MPTASAPTLKRRHLLLGLAALGCSRGEPAARTRATAPAATDRPPHPSPSASPADTLHERLYFPRGELFQKKRPPAPGDWLERFPERGQSFLAYQSSRPVRPDARRRRLVLAPLGRAASASQDKLDVLTEFMRLFFGVAVDVLAPIALPKQGQRRHPVAGRSVVQHKTSVLLETLKPRRPDDAIALLGVTWEDLYPDPEWNYVFGQASLDERVGVWSLARMQPAFWGEAASDEADRRALRRSISILAHETGHVFSMHHCIEFECLMNGVNSLDELDGQPGVLCPVCLRKLVFALGVDPVARYEGLLGFFERHRLDTLAKWTTRRLTQIRTG